MATYPHVFIGDVGAAKPTPVAVALSGDLCRVGDGVILAVINAGGSPDTVTLVTPGKVHGLDVADRTFVVAAGATGFIPVGEDYRDTSDNMAHITHSFVTTVTAYTIQI